MNIRARHERRPAGRIAGNAGCRGAAGDAPAGAGQFRLRQVASAAPPARTERALGPAGGHRSGRRFRHAWPTASAMSCRRGRRALTASWTRIARRGCAEHRVSAVLNLEGLDAESQMRCAARLPGRPVRVPTATTGIPALVVVDEAQLFAPAGRRRGVRGGAPAFARRHDQSDVPRPQARARRASSPPSASPSSPRMWRPRRPIS